MAHTAPSSVSYDPPRIDRDSTANATSSQTRACHQDSGSSHLHQVPFFYQSLLVRIVKHRSFSFDRFRSGFLVRVAPNSFVVPHVDDLFNQSYVPRPPSTSPNSFQLIGIPRATIFFATWHVTTANSNPTRCRHCLQR